MLYRIYFALLFFGVFIVGCREKKSEKVRLQLPITIKDGYGFFNSGSYSMLSPDRPGDAIWQGTYLLIKGIPTFLSNVTKQTIRLDSYQFTYQNFIAGNIKPESYQYLQTIWKWKPDTNTLSKKPIKCYVCTIKGYDERVNKWAVLIDTNYNLDFSDEQVFYPDPIQFDKEDVTKTNPIVFQASIYRNGQKQAVQIPITFRTSGNDIFYNFPLYGVAMLERDGKKTEIFISSDFTRPNFLEYANIGTADTPLALGKFDAKKLTAIGETIDIDGVLYKNNGVNVANNTLQLESVNADELRYSTKEGGLFYPFESTEFVTHKPVSLEAYKGKYVYVDFWETGCKPCLEAMPEITRLYDTIDRNKVEFIGIANASPEQLKRFLTNRKLAWPQIRADSVNKLIDTYNITAYPTTLLIDPDGHVAVKDISLTELEAKLNKLNLYK